MKTKNILRIVFATALILLAPFVAMQFTDEMRWSGFDFALAGVLLFGTGLAYELVASRTWNTAHKLAITLAIGAGLFLIVANQAVGLIESEDHPANMMYVGVLAVGAIGAVIGRFEPRGMARAMFATALAHALVAMITVVAGYTTGIALIKTSLLNSVFIALWLGSALLFRRASVRAEG